MTTRADDDTIAALPTEAWDADAADLDLLSTVELALRMNDADASVPSAVRVAVPAIAAAIDAIAARLASGGRLVYVGAGTSGRLAVVDAAECETTFATPPGQVVAVLAGGPAATAAAQEEAEDDATAGAEALGALAPGPLDAVVGISASGRTPFVLGALQRARGAASLTIGVACVEGSPLAGLAEQAIVVPVGPELIAGSTRLKAGTAQKLVLNMLSTLVMVRLGKTHGNLMVGVVATNDKLRARVREVVRHATGAEPEAIETALGEADGDAKVAIVMLACEVDAEAARQRLAAAGGVVRGALG